MEDKALKEQAKQLALEYLNKNRAESELEPLDEVGKMWWDLYGHKWISEAKAKSLNK